MDTIQPDAPPESGEPDGMGLGFATEEPRREPKRTRARKSDLKIDPVAIARRVVDFFDEDDQNRAADIEARLQRYAKFRMWTEGKDWPWEDCSDAAIPDMMTHSLKVQDTLHNAVMSTRPAVVSKALKKVDSEKQGKVDELLDLAGVTRISDAATRATVLAAMRKAAGSRVAGVTEQKRRRHYGHAAELVATSVASDMTGETTRWALA